MFSEADYEDFWSDNHGRCERAECRAEICVADESGNAGRENCPCNGDVPAAVTDGIDTGIRYCSDACLVLALAELAIAQGCGAFCRSIDVTGAAVAS